MKRVLLIVLCLLLLTGCTEKTTRRKSSRYREKNTETTEQTEQTKPTEKTGPQKQLLMLYMVGSDLETKAGLASEDIEEMLDSDICFDTMQVLLCTGGASYWWTEGISQEKAEVFELGPDGLEPVYTMKNDNMAQPQTLTEFLDYGYGDYQADTYSLILWNHGGGAILGFGADENHGYDTLSLAEMNEAFQSARLILEGQRFEWVGFDACLMSMLEVATMLTPYSDYMIASEEIEVGTGWNYHCLEDISREKQPTGEFCGKAIIDAYEASFTGSSVAPDYTLSALDLSRTDTVVRQLEALAAEAQDALAQGGYSTIARFRDQTKVFGKMADQSIYDAVDLYDLAENLKQLYPEQAGALQEALEELVVYHASNVRDAHGVAVYFPYENKECIGEWMEIYEATQFSDGYCSFIGTFTRTLTGESLTQWDIAQQTPLESEEPEGGYYVQLTESQCENFASAKFSVWEEDSPGSYICWLISQDVTLTADGKLTSGFRGKRLYIGNGAGDQLPCHASEIERNEEYVKYAIPLLVIPEGKEFWEMENAYLHVRVDAAHPQGVIIGVYSQMEADSTLFPNRNRMVLSEGDYVLPFFFAREILFREDGSVEPFESWKSTSGTGDGLYLNGGMTITIREPEEDAKYCCLFKVKDTQGNSYLTNPIYTTE